MNSYNRKDIADGTLSFNRRPGSDRASRSPTCGRRSIRPVVWAPALAGRLDVEKWGHWMGRHTAALKRRATGRSWSCTRRLSTRRCVSDGAMRRTLQMVGNGAELEVEIRNFAGDGRPVLLGVTERLEFVDAPGHLDDLARYRARGYAMKGNRIRLVTDRPIEIVEVHPPSVNSVDMAGVTVEYYPPHPAMGS